MLEFLLSAASLAPPVPSMERVGEAAPKIDFAQENRAYILSRSLTRGHKLVAD